MCDSVRAELHTGMGITHSLVGSEVWVWCLGPRHPELHSSLPSKGPIFAHCSPVLSLLSQTVWELFLWCSTGRWDNRDRRDVYRQDEVSTSEAFSICVLFSCQCSRSSFWPIYSFLSLCVSGTHVTSFLSILDSKHNHFYSSFDNIRHSLVASSFCVKEPVKHSLITIGIYLGREWLAW